MLQQFVTEASVMLPKKPAPAPVFNYRKRQRQAVFADPENHPAPTRSACDLRTCLRIVRARLAVLFVLSCRLRFYT